MHALSDAARLEILRQLIAKEDGECCCGEFCGDLAKATVSHHMRMLREAGLIQHRVGGTKSIAFLLLGAGAGGAVLTKDIKPTTNTLMNTDPMTRRPTFKCKQIGIVGLGQACIVLHRSLWAVSSKCAAYVYI